MIHGCLRMLSTFSITMYLTPFRQNVFDVSRTGRFTPPRIPPFFGGERTVCAQRSNMERLVVDVLASNLVEVLVCPQVRVVSQWVNQLELGKVVYLLSTIIYRVLAPSQVVGNGIYQPSIVDTIGGGNSNIFYFHPDPWGNDPIWLIFLENGLVQPPGREGCCVSTCRKKFRRCQDGGL